MQSTPSVSLEGKTIVVAGGSLGIGRAVSEACAHAGATVIAAARNAESLHDVRERLRAISPDPHEMFQLDVSQYVEVVAFAQWCRERGGNIDGVVNCAGVLGPIGEIPGVDPAEFENTIRINLLGTVYMCGVFSELLALSARGKIVNFSGGGAATPFPRYSAYAASKAAVVRFTETIAAELEPSGIEANCVAPGFVITRLHLQTLQAGAARVGEKYLAETRRQIAEGGVPPELAAELTVFLLSGASDGITGKFISAPWDPWREEEFRERLKADKDFAVLRRIDDRSYYKKP